MLGDLFYGADEERALSFQTIWGSGDFLELENESGTVVNQETAFQVNAIFSAVSLISDTISTLPVDSYIRLDGRRSSFRPRPTWVTQPDVDTTKEAFYGAVIVSMLLDGNAFIRVYSNRRGDITNLVVLNPLDVTIKRNGVGRVMYEVKNESRMVSADNMIHIPDVVRPGAIRGVSRVEALKEDFGLAIALRNYAARFFGAGATTQGIIEYPNKLTAEQAKNLQEGFDARHKGWKRVHTAQVFSPAVPPTNQPRWVTIRHSLLTHAVWLSRMLPGLSTCHRTCSVFPALTLTLLWSKTTWRG
jgi:phage portal protein BeeE